MKFIKYSKFSGDPFEGLSAEDLLQLLQDFLLESGFNSQYYNFYEMDPERTMEQLHQALGPEAVNNLSQLTGAAPHDLVSELSRILPGVVDRLTPQGRMPDHTEMSRW